MILLLIALPLAHAADPHVQIPGIGEVPLADAAATCNNGSAIGGVTAGKDMKREAALLVKARTDLADTPTVWPTKAIDIDYMGTAMTWTEPGVVTSCWAVARYHVALGIELRTLCDNDRSACRDRFAPNERDLVNNAIKSKVKDRRDDMFTGLALLPAMKTWQDPRPYLDKACAYPQQMASAGRFIDANDLEAAHSACVQLLELIQGDVSPTLAAMPCAGAWSTRPVDVLPSPQTDIGVIGAHPEIQIATTLDKLLRMNPGAGTCEASPAWGATWREGLVERWREAQAARACVDESLSLSDRLELCPKLVEYAETDCRRRDEKACDLLAQLHVEGVGVPVDEVAAMGVWAGSCNAAHVPACEALKARTPIVQEWLDAALLRTHAADLTGDPDPFTEAHLLLSRFGAGLGSEWVSTYAPTLFDDAITHSREKDAADVLSLYGATLGEAWKADARLRLGALQEALESGKK